MEFQYVRIQGRELSYVTKQQKGIFAICWRMIYDGTMKDKDAELFKSINDWFVAHLPEPDVCKSGSQAVITYFKVKNTEEMLKKLERAMKLVEKYEHPYDVVYTNFVGKIVYEDEFRIAVEVTA